jgi:hypothetical protein
MWDMFSNSLKLFCKGKLFRDPHEVLKRWLIDLVVVLAMVVVLDKAGLPLGLAVAMASVAGGLLQPWLFKDLKYN